MRLHQWLKQFMVSSEILGEGKTKVVYGLSCVYSLTYMYMYQAGLLWNTWMCPACSEGKTSMHQAACFKRGREEGRKSWCTVSCQQIVDQEVKVTVFIIYCSDSQPVSAAVRPFERCSGVPHNVRTDRCANKCT